LNNIFFDLNKSELKDRSITELDNVIRFLNENPKVRVEISGHTDNLGTVVYNQQLSLKRAQSVTAYLTAHGIDSKRVLQVGYGSQKPLKPNDTEENRQVNRRIEFRIIQ
jgi:outer membrane protein OmpA-like peptidoglycan-associated protein